MNPPLSILDLAPVASGQAPSQALREVVALARLGERLGYVRHWFAEHHSMPSVASSAPEVLIAHVAAHTQRLRVGSGGIMLPNHTPLRLAESFRSLAALYPGRIDLGLGRAPGSDATASRALRAVDGQHFPQLLAELLAYCEGGFSAGHPYARLHAMPDDAPLPPIWILGSSGASAQLAGASGFGYSFASHFSPMPAAPAFQAYRRSFAPSRQFPRPHAILGVAVSCAETQERAHYLAATMELTRLRIQRGEFLPLPSPEEALAYPYTTAEREILRQNRDLVVVGDPYGVRARLLDMAAEAGADELMIVCNMHDGAARLRAYELLAEVC